MDTVTSLEQRRETAWHSVDLPTLLDRLGSTDAGLSDAEAKARLERFGRNELPHKPPPTWWEILLRQFQNPLIYVLAIAAVVSVLVGELKDAAFIAAVLAINAVVGGFQEWKAERSAQALQKLLRIRASVERDGEVIDIDAEEIVPGDLVWLESGNRVPADMRLTVSHALEVDESLLTGESLAVMKDPAWIGAAETPLADRGNMVHAGSIVARGRGRGVVVRTGTETAVGQLAMDVLGTPAGKPPLVERMERFSRAVAVAVLIAAVIVVIIGMVGRGYSLTEMFFFAVALAVSAIPEGLPAALTVALAIAMTRMARRGVIVRRLTAVEGLGSCTLIASDKTGTLTVNELTVREIRIPTGEQFEVTGEGFLPEGEVLAGGYAQSAKRHAPPATDHKQLTADKEHEPLARLALAAVLCNEADLHRRNGEWVWHGDPTDIALLAMARKLGWNREVVLAQFPQVNQIPFEPEYKFSATYHADGTRSVPATLEHEHRGGFQPAREEDSGDFHGQAGSRPSGASDAAEGVRVFVKGAPERVLSMCELPGGAAESERLTADAFEMAEMGLRVLALAEGTAPADLDPSHAPPEPSQLRFLGFVGMIDPLRAGVRDAVEACHSAGIDVWMVTGDHPVTALAIARDLGLASDPEQVITGMQLAEMDADDLKRHIKRVRVFARVAPHQKLQLVQMARQTGHFVAVTGDGVNDAPALRAANIGVAMGRSGTDVAREAAELVISDDNFATIVAGVEEGRIAYNNIRNVIFLLVSTGAAEVAVAMLALAAGMPLPLLPVQLLWLNLVTNGIQGIALAFEPGKGNELRRRPRNPQEPIFNRLMIERNLVAASVMGVVGFATFGWLRRAGWSDESARNALLLLMVLFENIHIGNCRSETISAFRLSPLQTPILLAGALGAFLLHVAAMHLPFFQKMIATEPLDLQSWLTLFGLALTVFVAMEIHKWTWWLRHRDDEATNSSK